MNHPFLVATVLVVLSLAPSAHAGDHDAAAVVTRLHDNLLSVMKEADTLGVKGRYQRLAPEIEQTFHLTLMARITSGADWKQADTAPKGRLRHRLYAPQRRHLRLAFQRLLRAEFRNDWRTARPARHPPGGHAYSQPRRNTGTPHLCPKAARRALGHRRRAAGYGDQRTRRAPLRVPEHTQEWWRRQTDHRPKRQGGRTSHSLEWAALRVKSEPKATPHPIHRISRKRRTTATAIPRAGEPVSAA